MAASSAAQWLRRAQKAQRLAEAMHDPKTKEIARGLSILPLRVVALALTGAMYMWDQAMWWVVGRRPPHLR